jgi:6,7-dimethyl-8-ribityllumazine synthase
MNQGRPVELDPARLDGRGLRALVVAARFNPQVTDRLVEGAVAALRAHGVAAEDLLVVRVPGSFELAPTARRLARGGRFDLVVCLGAVIRGGTDHYRYVCAAATQGLTRLAQDAAEWGRHGVAVAFGVLTTRTLEQALERAGGAEGNKGADAALAALETARVWREAEAALPAAPVE